MKKDIFTLSLKLQSKIMMTERKKQCYTIVSPLKIKHILKNI